MNIYGVDVSKHQGKIDWPKVKAAGKDFAFIRLGWCGYDGRIEVHGGVDTMFHTNTKAAIAAGLHVGVYVYSYAKSAAAATIAARETLELVKPYQLDYPIAFDIESTSVEKGGVPHDKMTKAENTAIAHAFLSVIEAAGYYGLLYTYKSFADSYLNMSNLAKYDVWIAQYASKCSYGGKYGIWQYAGDTGRCSGVATACDLNVAYKDYAAIIRAVGLNNPDAKQSGTQEDLQQRLEDLQAAIDKIKAVVAKL